MKINGVSGKQRLHASHNLKYLSNWSSLAGGGGSPMTAVNDPQRTEQQQGGVILASQTAALLTETAQIPQGSEQKFESAWGSTQACSQ